MLILSCFHPLQVEAAQEVISELRGGSDSYSLFGEWLNEWNGK